MYISEVDERRRDKRPEAEQRDYAERKSNLPTKIGRAKNSRDSSKHKASCYFRLSVGKAAAQICAATLPNTCDDRYRGHTQRYRVVLVDGSACCDDLLLS